MPWQGKKYPVPMQMLLVLLVSGLLAGTVNLLHPHRIPWVQDWGNYVEAWAVQAGVDVIPLGSALSFHEAGEHLFVDARLSDEYEKGHIPGALSLPFDDMENHLPALEQVLESEHPIVVYCRNRECDDALLLALELREMGQSNLFYYVDGFELWEESGCPVETR
jgi:rhodanese-related sulfurtransferase